MMIKLGIIVTSLFLAITEVINEVTETAKKVGTLGMQGLLAFMLLVLFLVIYYQEKKRSEDRHKRDLEQDTRFSAVIKHHEDAVTQFNVERSSFTATLIDLNQKSVAAMEGMTVAMQGFKEWLQDRAISSHTKIQRRRVKK